MRREPTPGRRLRLAYVSPDFRVHPLAYLIADLLERHDRARFEVIGVSLGPSDGSDIRARIAGAFDRFHGFPEAVPSGSFGREGGGHGGSGGLGGSFDAGGFDGGGFDGGGGGDG